MSSDLAQARRLYQFLSENHSWNENFQALSYYRRLAPCKSPGERLRTLLFSTVQSQSKPKMSKLAPFWRGLEVLEHKRVLTLSELTEHLEKGSSSSHPERGPWERLFNALAGQPGWGKKTSALFVKATINIHRGPRSLRFLSDATTAKKAIEADCVNLPVDAVIEYVFKRMGYIQRPNFKSINAFLHANFSTEEMLIWDDLWFWGFFTQFVQGDDRKFEWNQDKFWSQIDSPKSEEATVRRLSKRFLKISQKRAARSQMED